MSERRTCELGNTCALPSLSAEVERVGGKAHEIFTVMAEVAGGLQGSDEDRRAKAWEILALLSGGLTMARTVTDAGLAEEIARAIERKVGLLESA